MTVIGLDGPAIGPEAAGVLAGARLVVGGRRHLALVAGYLPAGVPTVELGSLRAGLAAVAGADGPVAVLASGDPGWFGIVRAVATRLGRPPRVLPAPSSLSRLAAATGQPWDDVATFSAHGRDPRPAVNAARALPAVAVLTGPELTVADLARALDGWPRELTVGERLGHDDERITTCPAPDAPSRPWAEPNIVLVTDPARHRAGGARPMIGHDQPAARRGGWALPEHAFEHRDSMITKAEVRALAVAWLAPAVGQLVWDVGAGSGSVGIECGLHGAAVLAVERDPAGCDRIARNAARHGVGVRVVCGAAPGVLAGLPDPDAVFVGGGGPGVVAAVAALGARRVVVASAAVDRALTALATLRTAGYVVDGVQLAASRLADLPGGGVRLAALNPVTLLRAELHDEDEGRRP